MKTNAIVRIVLYSLLILILLGLLAWGMGGNFLNMPIFSENLNDDLRDGTEASSGSVAATEVRYLDIAWASGKILIQPADTDQIKFSETGNLEKPMVWQLTNGKLEIQFSRKGAVSLGSDFRKDLTIIVPREFQLESLDLDMAAADLQVENLNIQNVDIDGAAADCRFVNCEIGEMSSDGAAQELYLEGAVRELELDGASTSCVLKLKQAPQEIDVDGVSAQLQMWLPESSGFLADFDSLSHDFSSDFAFRTEKNRYRSGNEACRISVDGISTKVEIWSNQTEK